MSGYLSIVLTAHVPYLRAATARPGDANAFHELIATALVPTLNLLCDLRDAGLRPHLGLAWSPILLEQLADPQLQQRFIAWMDVWLERANWALGAWERQGEAHAVYLARFSLDWGQSIANSFVERHHGNLVETLRHLCAERILEPLASPATHAYLPLLRHPAAVRAQLNIGARTVARVLGVRPTGVWLPECGFHPQVLRPIRQLGLRYLIVDPASIRSLEPNAARMIYTATPDLTLLVRDESLSQLIWSSDLGYPGDASYRAARLDPASGLALWRHGIADDEPYDPYHAFRRASEHALHFSAAVDSALVASTAAGHGDAVVLLPIDAELLGRQWFEGPAWLRAVLEEQLSTGTSQLAGPAACLGGIRNAPPVTLEEGSWGTGGDHRDWATWAGLPLDLALSRLTERFVSVAKQSQRTHDWRERILNQAARELLLAQSSDWRWLVGRGNPLHERVQQQLADCQTLCDLAARDEAPTTRELAYLDELERLDHPFASLNFRVFL